MGRGSQAGQQEVAGAAIPRSEKPWVCPAFKIDPESKQILFNWMIDQAWPEGTEMTIPSKLHVTAFYAREGLQNPDFQAWVSEQEGFSGWARVGRVEAFDPGDRDTMVPVVLVLESEELVAAGERIAAEAEERFGIEPVRHPSGYKPHITVAKVPVEAVGDLPETPNLELRLGQLVEIHAAKFKS